MKNVFHKIPIVLFVFIFSLFPALPVFAHGDEPRIEISPETLNPGSVLDIRGVDFGFEQEVALAIVGTEIEIPLSTVIADEEGIFLLTIILPVDLAEGAYLIRGVTDDHTVDSPQLTVWGSAVVEGGGQGARDEDDGLLAPMPTYAPAAATQVLREQIPVEAEAPASSSKLFIWVAVGLGLGLIVFLAMRRIRKP